MVLKCVVVSIGRLCEALRGSPVQISLSSPRDPMVSLAKLIDAVLDTIRRKPVTAVAVTNTVSLLVFLYAYARSHGISLSNAAALGAIALAKAAAPGVIEGKRKVRVHVDMHC